MVLKVSKWEASTTILSRESSSKKADCIIIKSMGEKAPRDFTLEEDIIFLLLRLLPENNIQTKV